MKIDKYESLQHLQWQKAREIIHNIYESQKDDLRIAYDKAKDDAIEQKETIKHRVQLVTHYLEDADPMCKIEFIKDDEGKTFNIKLDYNPNLQQFVDAIMATGSPEITVPVQEDSPHAMLESDAKNPAQEVHLVGVESSSEAMGQKPKRKYTKRKLNS